MSAVTERDDRAEWASWLRSYGAEAFWDAFMENAQGAESRCRQCGETITLDIREGGGVPDWGSDGDYGCWASPDTNDEGTGGHMPVGVRR